MSESGNDLVITEETWWCPECRAVDVPGEVTPDGRILCTECGEQISRRKRSLRTGEDR